MELLISSSRKFSALYKEYHNENKSVNTQPPTSAKYLLRLYPATIERDALLESAEIDYQYKYVWWMRFPVARLEAYGWQRGGWSICS